MTTFIVSCAVSINHDTGFTNFSQKFFFLISSPRLKMECLLGVKGRDFVILAADRLCARSIVIMKASEVKMRSLGSPSTHMAYSGESGDAVNFAEYIQANAALVASRYGAPQSCRATANFTRKTLAEALRSRKPYQANILIGGVDNYNPSDADEKSSSISTVASTVIPRLYWIDYLAAMTEIEYAAHGAGQYFCLGLLDREWRAGMDQEQALALVQKCIDELATRFLVQMPQFSVRVITKDGFRDLIMSAKAMEAAGLEAQPSSEQSRVLPTAMLL